MMGDTADLAPMDVVAEDHAVVAEGIEQSYGVLDVLKGVSFAAPVGSVTAFIGSSGSGKSTLLQCLNLLVVPRGGRLSIAGEAFHFEPGPKGDGRPPDSRRVHRLRGRVAMVFQDFNLWPHMTVLGNVIEAPIHAHGVPKAEAVARAEAYLERVGMIDKRNQYASFLSGGQQQRVAIARALAVEPRILLFDEPTSALDPELVGEVLAVIRDLAEEGRTMLLVTHEMSFARDVSSQVVFLHNGLVEEIGPPEKVFNDPDSERCRQFVSSVAA
jgi:ABC-type histidine transport system ATPase subunit